MNKYNYEGPAQFTPLSPWAYFGLSLLFSVPVVGFVFLIVFSFMNSNINRRNFARSYWCIYIVIAIIIAVLFVLALAFGLLSEVSSAPNFTDVLPQADVASNF